MNEMRGKEGRRGGRGEGEKERGREREGEREGKEGGMKKEERDGGKWIGMRSNRERKKC